MLGIKNIQMFLDNPLEFLDKIGEDPGVLRLRLGGKPFVFVFEPVLARKLLLNRDGSVKQNRGIFDRIQPVTGASGLVQQEGKASREMRSKVMHIFTTRSLDQIQKKISEIVDSKIAAVIESGSTELDISAFCNELVLETALQIFVGKLPAEDSKLLAESFLELNKACGGRMRSALSIPLWIPIKQNRNILRLKSSVREILGRSIQEKSDSLDGQIYRVFKDDPTVIDQCLTFLFAGHETTASSIAFTILELAKNLKMQDMVAFGEPEYRRALYKESLRMHPPAYMLARQIEKGVELEGFRFKKGDQVIIGVKQMHQMAEFFPNPKRFDWQRFHQKDRPHVAFIPFGLGAKSCIGEQMAMMEADLILQKFCQKFGFTRDLSQPIKEKAFITLHPESGQLIDLTLRAGGGIHDSRANVI